MKELTASIVDISSLPASATAAQFIPARTKAFERSRKLHLYYGVFFSLLILFNFALLPATVTLHFYSTIPGPNLWLVVLLTGVHIGQWFLLGMWMSFGCFRAPWRQLICTLLVFSGSAMFMRSIAGRSEVWIPLALLVTSTFWFMYAGLLLVRSLASITFEFEQLQSVAKKSPRRFSISSILGFTFVLTIPCALLQWAISIHEDLLAGSIAVTVIAIVVLVSSMPMTLAMLMPSHALRWSAAALLPFGLTLGLVYQARTIVGIQAVVVLLGVGTAVFVNLCILRWLGARWLSTVPASNDGGLVQSHPAPTLN